MGEVIDIIDPSEFDEKFEELSKSEEFFICIFTGATNPLTGKNWCPDCEVAKPNIENVLIANAAGTKILMCYIANRNE